MDTPSVVQGESMTALSSQHGRTYIVVVISLLVALTAGALISIDFSTVFPDTAVIPDQARAQYVALAGFHYALATLPTFSLEQPVDLPVWHEFAAGQFSVQRFAAANDRVHVVVTAEVGEQQNTLWRVVDRTAFHSAR